MSSLHPRVKFPPESPCFLLTSSVLIYLFIFAYLETNFYNFNLTVCVSILWYTEIIRGLQVTDTTQCYLKQNREVNGPKY